MGSIQEDVTVTLKAGFILQGGVMLVLVAPGLSWNFAASFELACSGVISSAARHKDENFSPLAASGDFLAAYSN